MTSGFISYPYILPAITDVGGSFLIMGEIDALGIDFSYPVVAEQMRIYDTVTPANNYHGDPASKLTYTAPSVKWTLRATGFYASTNGTTDLPYEWDSSRNLLGILLEEARTNLAWPSDDFTNANWTKSNLTAAKTATGPDGVANSASTLTATAGNATALQAISSGSAARVTSMFIRRRTGTGNIDLTQDNGSLWTTITTTTAWTRVSIAAVTSANPTVGIRIVTSGDAVDVAFFQHEVGAFFLSPIRTTTVAVTRALDDLRIATALYPHSDAVGTLVAKASMPRTVSLGTYKVLATISDGTSNEKHTLFLSDAVTLGIYDVRDANIVLAAIQPVDDHAANVPVRLGGAYQLNNVAGCSDGGEVGSDSSCTMPTVNVLKLGQDYNGGFPLNGHLSQLVYLKRRASAAQLQQRSTEPWNANKNIKTDFHAVGDGVTDDSVPFRNYRSYGRVYNNDSHRLNIPAGSYYLPIAGINDGYDFSANIRNLTVAGEGIGVTTLQGITFGGREGPFDDGTGHQAIVGEDIASTRIETCGVGSTAIKLVDITKVSIFAPSYSTRSLSSRTWLLISGFDMQASGSPTNPRFMEFNEVRSIDAVNGIIYLMTPLKYGYRSTYPEFETGDATHLDHGGPATVYRLNPSFEADLTFQDMTLNQASMLTQIHGSAQAITINRCDMSARGLGPSGTRDFTIANSVLGQVEFDKQIENLTLTDCDSTGLCIFQSASIHNAILEGVHLTTLTGTPLNCTIRSSAARASVIGDLQIGPTGFGVADSLAISDATISSFGYTRRTDTLSDFTVSTNTLSRAVAFGPVRWAHPGVHMFFCKSDNIQVLQYAFQVTDCYESGGFVIIETDYPGTIPTTVAGDSALNLIAHPMRSISVSNCTGCDEMLELSLASSPTLLNQYVNRTKTGNTLFTSGSQPSCNIWGTIVSLKVNVTQAYTGGGGLFLNVTGNASAVVSGVLTGYAPLIDLNTVGLRTITPAGVTGSVGADSILTPDASTWFTRYIAPFITFDISGQPSGNWPIVNIELITDQGIVFTPPYDTGEAPYFG